MTEYVECPRCKGAGKIGVGRASLTCQFCDGARSVTQQMRARWRENWLNEETKKDEAHGPAA